MHMVEQFGVLLNFVDDDPIAILHGTDLLHQKLWIHRIFLFRIIVQQVDVESLLKEWKPFEQSRLPRAPGPEQEETIIRRQAAQAFYIRNPDIGHSACSDYYTNINAVLGV